MKLVSLSRAIFLGFVRDRTALVFSILLPVLFLLFFGTIYKNTSTPKIDLIAVGQVSLIKQAEAADPAALAKILSVTTAKSLPAALADVSKGNADAVILQHGNAIDLRYSIADPTKAGIVQEVVSSIISAANQAGTRRGTRWTPARSRTSRSSRSSTSRPACSAGPWPRARPSARRSPW
jgi:ABC-2 type transport system permease protein